MPLNGYTREDEPYSRTHRILLDMHKNTGTTPATDVTGASKPCWRFTGIKFIWYDLWVGVFVDVPNQRIYVAPLPMIVFKFEKV